MEITHDQLVGTSASAGAAPSNGSFRAASTSKGKKPFIPNWPAPVVSLLNTVLEDGDFEEAYSSMMGMVGQGYQPDVDFILRLYSIILHPEECISTRTSNSSDVDMFTVNPTSSSLRAYQLLSTFLRTNGPSRLLCNLPRRYNDIPFLPPTRPSLLDLTHPDDLKELTEVKLAARRLGECKDVWDIVAGKSGKEGARGSKESGKAISENGWKVLELLVQAWEKERDVRAAEGDEKPCSPSLLSQFGVTGLGLPSDFSAVMSVVFDPFTPEASERATVFQEIELSMRLLDLLAELADADKLDQASMLREITERMNGLGVPEFKDLVVTILNKHPNFKIRLFTRYLERYSAPIQVTVIPDSPPTTPKLKASHAALSDYEDEITFVKQILSPPKVVVPSSQTDSQTSLHTGKGSSNGVPSGGPTPSASPRRNNGSQGSMSPSKRPVIEPIHTPASKAMSNLFSKIPKENDPARAIKRVPKRVEADGSVLVPPRGPSISAINAELKFAAIKLELARMFVHYARLQGEKELLQWELVLLDGKLKRAMRNGRKQLLSSEGNLPEQIKRLEIMEDAVLSTVL